MVIIMRKNLIIKLEQGYYSEIYEFLDKEIDYYSLDNLRIFFPNVKSMWLYNYMIYAISRNETLDKYITIFGVLAFASDQFIDDDHTLIRWYALNAISKFPDSVDMQKWVIIVYYGVPTAPFSDEEFIQFAKDVLKKEPDNKHANEVLTKLS